MTTILDYLGKFIQYFIFPFRRIYRKAPNR